jgi:tripartite motif-containing protein 71
MWNASRRAQDRLNDYWNALVRRAPADELARLRAQIDPELTATIDSAIALHRRRRPDSAFGDRLEGELMNAFAVSGGGTAAIPRIRPQSANGTHEQWTPAKWIPSLGEQRGARRLGLAQLGLVALLLLTLIGGYFVYSSQSDNPAVLQQGTPVSTPTADWTNTRGDAGRSGLGASGPVGQPVTIWRFQASGPCETAPAAVGDTVYAACGSGVLSALDRATGEERWTFDTQSQVGGGPTVHQGIVVLVDVDGRLYGVDAQTGEQRWVDEGSFNGAPVAQDGLILTGGFDGYLRAIDIATGQERWSYLIEAGGEAKNPAVGDGIVYSGSIANGFTAVDLQTGALIWNAETDGIETGTAVVANGVAYIGSAPGAPQGFLNAYDAATGVLLWSSDEPIFSPAVKDGAGFAGSADGPVTAIDLATGEVLWQVTVGGVARPASVAGDVVYMNSDGDQAIYAFDTATGDQLWKFSVDGFLNDAPALKDGVLYTATGSGSVYALGGENAIPAANITAGSPEPAASPSPIAAASPAASPVALAPAMLWSSQGGDSGLSQAGLITIAPDGKIWVADNDNHRFQILAPDGTFLETWGGQGSGNGQFQMYADIERNGYGKVAFVPDGSFYVLDPGNHRVQQFDANRTFIRAIGSFGQEDGQFVTPIGLTVDADGGIWVYDTVRRNLQHFSADGALLGAIPVDVQNSNGQFVAPDGSLYLTDCGARCTEFHLQHYGSDGAFLATIDAPDGVPWTTNQPASIAFDADGRLFVTSMNSEQGDGAIAVFDANGTYLADWAIGGFPFGIAFDQSGVVVGEWVGDTVTKYELPVLDQPAALAATLGWSVSGGDGGFNLPGRVAVAPDGAIWVVDSADHRFQIFDGDGNFLETWGEQGKGDGQFQLLGKDRAPFGDIVFAPDGSFFVLDPGNGRVQAFGADRQFRFSFGSFGAGDGQFTVPLDIALAPDGTLWVTDDRRQDAQQFDQEGNFLSSFDSTAFVPGGAGYWFAWDHRVAADGNHYFTVAGPTTRPSGEPFFNVVVTDAGGTFLRTLGPNPDGTNGFEIELTEMAIGPDGNLYVGSGGNGSSVFVFAPSGALLGEIPTDAQVQGVAFDPAGNLIVLSGLDDTLSSYQLSASFGMATPVA